MGSHDRSILVFEWLTGGGCWCEGVDPVSQPGLLKQGRQMLHCVVTDFLDAGFDVYSTIDSRVDLRLPNEPSTIGRSDSLDQRLGELADEVDFIAVIAPETGGRLSNCLGWIQNHQNKWLNPDLAFTALASDKNRMQDFLHSHGIPVPRGARGDLWHKQLASDEDAALIVKPVDGCGGQGNELICERNLESTESTKFLTQEYRIEEFVEGVSVSVGLLSNGTGHQKILKPQRQHFCPEPIGSFSHCTSDLTTDHVRRAFTLAEKLLPAIPTFRGYIGVDMILGNRDVTVEINPRVTASYGASESPAKWFAKNLDL